MAGDPAIRQNLAQLFTYNEISRYTNLRQRALRAQGKDLEAQRLEQRARYDMEMLRELGFCSGIENYSRHLSGRAPGEPPPTLLDYLPADAVVIVDESHQTVPQVRGMYHGDRSRKETLVEYGFRLPSALDNRPLRLDRKSTRLNSSHMSESRMPSSA